MKPTIEVTMSPKLLAFLRAVAKLEGFGDSPEKVMERFAWDGVNRLLEVGRLTQAWNKDVLADGSTISSR